VYAATDDLEALMDLLVVGVPAAAVVLAGDMEKGLG
jgi:hypothetical protein